MNLFDEIKAAGVPFASHESDLYLPDSPQVREILKRYPNSEANAERFRNQVEGGIWVDVPFAYLPFWEARTTARQ